MEWGLLTRVVPDDELDAAAEAMARKLAALPQNAVRLNKALINRVYELMGFRDAIAYREDDAGATQPAEATAEEDQQGGEDENGYEGEREDAPYEVVGVLGQDGKGAKVELCAPARGCFFRTSAGGVGEELLDGIGPVGVEYRIEAHDDELNSFIVGEADELTALDGKGDTFDGEVLIRVGDGQCLVLLKRLGAFIILRKGDQNAAEYARGNVALSGLGGGVEDSRHDDGCQARGGRTATWRSFARSFPYLRSSVCDF